MKAGLYYVLVFWFVALRNRAQIIVSLPTLREGEEYLRPRGETQKLLMQLLDAEENPLESVDWRKVDGRVSSVKRQGKCNSCWAFALAGLLEGQQAAVGDANTSANCSVVDLSAQNLIDCNLRDGKIRWHNSCAGGRISVAFADIKRLGGIMAEKDYPYTGVDGNECKFNKSLAVMNIKLFALIRKGSELDLQKLVARYGPVAVRVEAGGWMFRGYREGVHYDPKCGKLGLYASHNVLVVGYGTDEEEGDYWIVKNTWGEKWGERGYIRMARNRDGNCGITSEFWLALL